ncbi:unnamed protein product [Somion occarium]|uniref:DUF4336 domain-containing protein n=1 Tax=Somion occarium TaxID=3059160 RepID=A0ABP1DLV6_9APHY
MAALSEDIDDVVIREVAQDVWSISRPFTIWKFVPVGGHSVAIKLKSGHVWLFAWTPLTDLTRSKIAELGEVKYIIAPNPFHYYFLKSYRDAFPDALVIEVDVLNTKLAVAGWQLDAVITAEAPMTSFGFEDEIEHWPQESGHGLLS